MRPEGSPLLGGASCYGCGYEHVSYHGYTFRQTPDACMQKVENGESQIIASFETSHYRIMLTQAALTIPPTGVRVHPESSALTTFKSASSVEDQLRHVTQIKRIRVSEFFKDFDPLRSGYITSKNKSIHVNFSKLMDAYLYSGVRR